MAQEPVLSEVKPTAGVPTVLYVTQQGQTAQGTVFCMNQNPTKYGDAISVALVSNGNVLTSNCYICYQSTINYGHSVYLQQICLGSQDNVFVTSQNGTTNFIFTGMSET
jgi:hypothetical protein